MAKKKKPAANPARGFATTSIASKPKPEKAIEAVPALEDATVKAESGTVSVTSAAQSTSAQPVNERESHELSPEELEKRLEETELQGLVDRYAAKSQRDSSRHVAKLTTDYRILRGHAQPLPNRALLGDDVTSKILELAAEDVKSGKFASIDEKAARKVLLQEEDTTGKLWTLQKSLLGLGFAQGHVDDALRFVLRFPPSMELGVSVWGLEECLDWLVLNLKDEDLPLFDSQTGKIKDVGKLDVGGDISDGSMTPSPAIQTPRNEPIETQYTPDTSATPVTIPDEDEMVVSDLESDLEPDELLAAYVSTKLRLYEARPELSEQTKRKPANKIVETNAATIKDTPGIKKLQNRLQKIESDVLLDKREAEQQWVYKRNQIAQDVAERRRLQLPEQGLRMNETGVKGQISQKISHPVFQPKSEVDDSSSSSDDDDDEDNAFGDLFAAVPSDMTNGTKGQSPNGQEPSSRGGVSIKDFGQIQGLTPWRVLEEACRARDPRSSVVFKHVSTAAFANRHAVTVTWSKEQDVSPPLQIDIVQTISNPNSCSFTMVSIATPDMQQSKAYISTFALFQVFSMSRREEKAYLRLAPVWRDLWMEFADRRKNEAEAADRETVRNLRDIARESLKSQNEHDDVVLTRNFQKRINDGSGRSSSRNSEKDITAAPVLDEQQLKDLWSAKSSTPSYQRMLLSRMNLPMFKFRDAALSTVEHSQVTIICGETGCGKSTQMPSFILERELSLGRPCKIYCTEPRRISAITLAQRVSEELGEGKNDLGGRHSMVGYAIRLESHVSSSSRLVYATTGIVLRMLESSDGFEGVTHIVIDEVHERSIETDFLLIILRSLISKRPELKVILMSATVDAQRFSAYFYGAPILTVPGRTFPVDTKFLEDAIELTGYSVDETSRADFAERDEIDDEEQVKVGSSKGIDASLQQYSSRTRTALSKFDEYRIDYSLIMSLINMVAFDAKYSRYSKAVLVFLPGIAEIRRLNDMLHGTPLSQQFLIHSLHSSIASEDQQAAFNMPPPGMGKIVLSTNIAETGVTIPDITCVIDTGKHKEMRFDERRQISRLIESFVSRANAKQRRGRAGRVQDGLCFHLFTKARHDEAMSDQQTPEMLRLSLQDLVMRVKICKLGDIQSTLAEALDPPSAKNIRRAIDALIDVGALTSSEELTQLGQQLSKLPLDPFLGKLVLFGAVFGCLDISLTLAAILTSKSPFVTPIGGRSQLDAARQYFKKGDSDLLTEFNAYAAWRRVCTTSLSTSNSTVSEYQFCRKSLLSPQTLGNIEDLKAQLLSSIADLGLINLSTQERSTLSRIQNSTGSRYRRFVAVPSLLNAHASNTDLVTSVIAWSFYPKLLTRDGKGWRNIATNQSISLHPSSVVRAAALPHVKYLSFYSILQSGPAKHYNANSLTPSTPLPLLLLAGDAIFHGVSQVVIIDGARLRFALDGWKALVALKYLRRRLEEVVQRSWRGDGARGGPVEMGRRLERWWRVWGEIVEGWAVAQAGREA